MWDPKTMFQDRTPPPLRDAPRLESERPAVTISDRVVLALASPLQPTREWASLHMLGFKNYRHYQSSDLWRRIRADALRRAENVCEACHSAPSTLVHYLDHNIRTLAGQNMAGVMVICKGCRVRCRVKREGGRRRKDKRARARRRTVASGVMDRKAMAVRQGDLPRLIKTAGHVK